MIVHQFRAWAQTASSSRRADGASALARAFLYSRLDAAQRAEALDVLTSFLDDPSPLVRRALAEAFASAVEAPPHILLALADDQPSIAAIVLGRSPVLRDAELIDCAATAGAVAQAAIASRPALSPLVASTLAEIGEPEALIALARNAAITLSCRALRRMVARHGDQAELREALLARPDLPAPVRVELVTATATALAALVTERNWLSGERMNRVSHEAKDKAAIVIAGSSRAGAAELVAHLRDTGQLSVSFVFRTILSGRLELFKAMLVVLSDVAPARVEGLVAQSDSAGFAALYRKAGLPLDLLPAVHIALRAIAETDWTLSRGVGLSRHVVERVLTACATINHGEFDKLLVLLRRFEAEAARDSARSQPQRDLSTPLALTDRRLGESEPLVLTDFDAVDDGQPTFDGRQSARSERTYLRIDLAAIEAELCAA